MTDRLREQTACTIDLNDVAKQLLLISKNDGLLETGSYFNEQVCKAGCCHSSVLADDSEDLPNYRGAHHRPVCSSHLGAKAPFHWSDYKFEHAQCITEALCDVKLNCIFQDY